MRSVYQLRNHEAGLIVGFWFCFGRYFGRSLFTVLFPDVGGLILRSGDFRINQPLLPELNAFWLVLINTPWLCCSRTPLFHTGFRLRIAAKNGPDKQAII